MKSTFDGTLKWGVCFWDHFFKILQFRLRWWCHWLKIGLKGAQTCISCTKVDRKMKIKSKRYFRWIICLWNRFLKIVKFWHNVVTSSTRNWLEKRPKLISHVLIVIERWKSKVKGTLRWVICLWNYSLEILKF